MFFEISKLSKFFIIAPLTWIVVSLIFFFIAKRKVWRYIWLGLTIALFIFFTNPYIVGVFKYKQTSKYAESTMQPDKVYPAAVVMGGFSSVNQHNGSLIFVDERADRLWEAVRLYKQGKVEKILITGDPATLMHNDGTSDSEKFLDYMEIFGVPRDAFILERHARNTRENAVLARKKLDEYKIPPNEILLITSASHMERSLGVFNKLDIHPDYYAVTVSNPPEKFTHMSLYPSWQAATDWEELFNEWVGTLSYRIAGYM